MTAPSAHSGHGGAVNRKRGRPDTKKTNIDDRNARMIRAAERKEERNLGMKLTRVMVYGLASVLLASGLTGCNKGVKAERDRLFAENQDLRGENSDLKQALDACEGDRAEATNQVARYRDENQQLQQELNNLTAKQNNTGFENIPGVTGERSAGEVSARVEGDVLFSSGKVELKSTAKKTLDQIAQVLNSSYSGMTIRIEGHTDADPIRKSPWKTNDRLSAERALAVKDYLKSRGVDPKRMYIAGFGPNRLMGTKAQSRRVEIVVLLNK